MLHAMDNTPSDTRPTVDPLRIDIVSDVVCPWCIVGYRQLAAALERTGTRAEIHWHPFELNPAMPDEGEHLGEHIARKYGSSPAESAANRRRLTELGDSLGFEFRFGDDKRILPTFRAHQLLAWAGERGREHELKLALLAAYFTDDRDVADAGVLAAIAGDVGLDPGEAAAVLADGRYADVVRERERYWTEQGIRGVPAMVFDEKHLVTGAQGVENYESVLRRVKELAAADA